MQDKLVAMYLIAGEDRIIITMVKNTLKEFQDLLQCKNVCVQRRNVGGKLFNIICNEDGLLVPDCKLSAIDKYDYKNVLVGNIIILGASKEQFGLTSLTQEELLHLMDNMMAAHYKDGSKSAMLNISEE